MSRTSSCRIIFVHGLASKPSSDALLGLWRQTLIANVAVDSKSLASDMEADTQLFRSAYWADAVPDHIEDTPAYVTALHKAVDRLIERRREQGSDLHISKAGWVAATVEKFGLSIVDTLARAISVKDNVIDQHLREVRLYNRDQYIADRIRAPLEEQLRQAWGEKRRIIIISHSMGTFISYDVLWRFSHRSEACYKSYHSKAVDLLVTMGSPLGDPTLRSFMLIDRWKGAARAKTKGERRRFYPTNLRAWHNYSAYGDVVCHDATLEDDFFAGMRKQLGGFGRKDLRDYVGLYNPFENPQGQPNPHKSYGYLIQPKLSQKLREFFG